ncbi:hypothetical protein [Enterococcus diestrammenae]
MVENALDYFSLTFILASYSQLVVRGITRKGGDKLEIIFEN